MRRFLVETLPSKDHPVELNSQESHHALHVLRLKDGDQVEAMDGRGGSVITLVKTSSHQVYLHYSKAGRVQSDAIIPLRLSLALTKATSFEWVIEKAVELGVKSFEPILSDQSVIKLNKGIEHYLGKWQKIADQALKQCGRLEKLVILPPVKLSERLNQPPASSLLLCCNETLSHQEPTEHLGVILQKNLSQKINEINILIGPEGGWSQNELQLISQSSYQSCSLGALTLRAETAAVYCSSLINSFFYWTKTQ